MNVLAKCQGFIQRVLEGRPVDLAAGIEEIEKDLILVAFQTCNRNTAMAARMLGFHRTTLHQKLVRYGIISPDKPGLKRCPECREQMRILERNSSGVAFRWLCEPCGVHVQVTAKAERIQTNTRKD